MKENISIFDVYKDCINKCEWKHQIEVISNNSENIQSQIEIMCHAALLSENCANAKNFLMDVAKISENKLKQEHSALLMDTLNRLDVVCGRGGWLPINEAEDIQNSPCVPFPKDIFPPEIEQYLKSVVSHVQAPSEMVFSSALATFALCLQGKYRICYPSGNGHKEHLCLYIVIVADPGERKSGVFSNVNRPVREWQTEKRKEYKLALAEYDTQKAILEGQRESLKKRLSGKNTKEEDKSQIKDELTAITADLEDLKLPVSPEIIVTDTTIEALADLMQATDETAGIFSDEADFFKVISGIYSGGQPGNLQLPLKAYDGAPVYLVRRGRTIHLERPLLSICLMVQPSLFIDTLGNSELKGRGMIGRLVTCTPQKMAGNRNARDCSRLDETAYIKYKETLLQFLDIEQKANEDIPCISWEPEAADKMLDYLQQIEDSMKEGCPMEENTDYASKAAGVAIRICGILHMIWTRSAETSISLDTVKKAIELHTYFFFEKIKDIKQNEIINLQISQKVKNKIKELTIENGISFIPGRTVYQKMKGAKGLKNMEDFDLIFEKLEEEHILEIVKTGNKRLLYISPLLK